MTKDEIIKNLRQKLRTNYEEYMRKLNAMAPLDLIEQAAEIAAAKQVYNYLSSGEGYDPAHLEYLLRFKNPLDVARDQWLADNEFMGDFNMHTSLSNLVGSRAVEISGHELDEAYSPGQREGLQLC